MFNRHRYQYVMVAAMAMSSASTILAQRESFTRRQDALVAQAVEQARPVRREKRIAAIMGVRPGLEARLGKKYQIEVISLDRWAPTPFKEYLLEQEHAEPVLVQHAQSLLPATALQVTSREVLWGPWGSPGVPWVLPGGPWGVPGGPSGGTQGSRGRF